MTRIAGSICLKTKPLRHSTEGTSLSSWYPLDRVRRPGSQHQCHLDQAGSGGEKALGPSGLWTGAALPWPWKEAFFPEPNHCYPSERHADMHLSQESHPSSTIQGWRTTPPPFLCSKRAPIYLWQILPNQALTFQPGTPFLHPTAEKMNKYITCTGSQDERGVQDELCCRQCPHLPVHSDPARTPVVWDPVNTPKVTSLASWQNSMQYIYDAFLPEKDSLWSHPPKPPAYF